jgi:hypothetical protein
VPCGGASVPFAAHRRRRRPPSPGSACSTCFHRGASPWSSLSGPSSSSRPAHAVVLRGLHESNVGCTRSVAEDIQDGMLMH